MICRLCGQRHASREEAAAAHAPRSIPVTNITVVEPIEPVITERSKAEQKEEIEVIYRGRKYLGTQAGEKVEITLKNGKTVFV